MVVGFVPASHEANHAVSDKPFHDLLSNSWPNDTRPRLQANCQQSNWALPGHSDYGLSGDTFSGYTEVPRTVIKKELKLNLPDFEPMEQNWKDYVITLRAALLEVDMSSLLRELETNADNAKNSKILMLQFYKKLKGSALKLFTFRHAETYFMEGGRRIEMLHLLASKFNPMDANSVSQTINKLHDLKLDDSQDLSVYFDSLLDYNMQLSWVKQDMSDKMLLWFAQKQLKASCYKADVESLERFSGS